jgi:hypothetical protein
MGARRGVLSSGMLQLQSLPGLAALGWTRLLGAPLPVLFLKTSGVLAAALFSLRLLSLG